MKQPNRYFRVSVKAGQQPELIVADTLEDAQCQAEEWAAYESGTVVQFYQKFRKAPSLQVGDVRNIGVAPL